MIFFYPFAWLSNVCVGASSISTLYKKTLPLGSFGKGTKTYFFIRMKIFLLAKENPEASILESIKIT